MRLALDNLLVRRGSYGHLLETVAHHFRIIARCAVYCDQPAVKHCMLFLRVRGLKRKARRMAARSGVLPAVR